LEDPPLRVVASVLDSFDGWIDLAARPVDQVVAYFGETYPEWSGAERLRRALSITGTAPGVFREGRERFARLLAEHGEHLPPVSEQLPPTLVIYGDVAAGGMLAAADAAWFAASAPRAEAVQVPGAGHSIHRERPTEFLALAVPFLRAAS
jgi:pimeloyl-ACP methyl ester carboxylesterase